MNSFLRKPLAVALAALVLVCGNLAAQVITEFKLANAPDSPGAPSGIALGTDGNLWFTLYSIGAIGRITPTGVVTEFRTGLSRFAGPLGITAGPDGNMWFTEESSRIGRITPAGVITEFSAGISANAGLRNITAGPDGNLWFTESFAGLNGAIGRITPTGVVTEFTAGLSRGAWPSGITAGPDGNIWFTENGASRIGRITPAGVITEFPIGGPFFVSPLSITAGPDGNLWFTELSGNRIGRITPAGAITEFEAGISPNAGPDTITMGADGNLWFTEYTGNTGNRIARITPAGVITEFAGISPFVGPAGIVAGADGNLWFTEILGNAIGRFAVPSGKTFVSPVNGFFPYDGTGAGTSGNGQVSVTAPANTTWTAVSNVSWLTVVSGASGTGNGKVYFSVAPNIGTGARMGTLTIAGWTFTVTQLGAPPAGNASIVEYYDAVDDDYFITADPTEQSILDAAARAGAVWKRTGGGFNSGGTASVYRFLFKSQNAVNTHFYTTSSGEYSSLLANNPLWILESPFAFYMTLANADQSCPSGTIPVYRAAKLQTGGHRFTTSLSAITGLGSGWTNEGTAFCAPQ